MNKEVFVVYGGEDTSNAQIIGVFETLAEANKAIIDLGLEDVSEVESHLLTIADTQSFDDHETNIMLMCLLKTSIDPLNQENAESFEKRVKEYIRVRGRMDPEIMNHRDIDNLIEFEYLQQLQDLVAKLYKLTMGLK